MSNYQIIDAKNRKKLREILSSKGQALLPFLDAIERTEIAIDEVIDVAGRATIEAVLDLSAQSVAGEKHPGKKGSDVRWHGRQGGVVSLAERKLRVSRPRLRRKGKAEGGEVAIPAYEAVNNSSRLSQRIWEILMLGVSTRKYASVLPEMAETVGVSKSEVSRKFVEASAEQLQGLMERPLDELEIAVVYLDGIRFGEHHALAAIGVDTEGYKHVLGLRDGASENQIVCKALLEDLVERGLSPERCRLFVIDGSKALRVAVDAVFGTHNKVQRCRKHKERNVLGYLPQELKPQVQASLRSAWQLPAKKGKARLGCLRCLLLVMCTHPFAKKAFTLHLSRSEGHERYFGCNLMHRKALASSHQHLMAEAPGIFLSELPILHRFVSCFRRMSENLDPSLSSLGKGLLQKALDPLAVRRQRGKLFLADVAESCQDLSVDRFLVLENSQRPGV